MREIGIVEPLAQLVARARALHEAERRVEPVAAGTPGFRGNNLYPLAIFELGVQGHHRPVHLRTAAAVSQIGVQRVGKVDRGRALRQIDDPALRREQIDGLVERGMLVLLDPVARIDHVVTPGEHLAQQCDFLVEGIGLGAPDGRRAGFLVAPVGGDA